MEELTELAVPKKSRNKINKNKLDELITDKNIIETSNIELPITDNYYKNNLKVYVLSGQIKDLYGKIITEHELHNLSEQECENIYKICELKTAKRISDSVIDGVVTIVGNLFSKTLPIEDKDKYVTDLKNDYIINSELKNVAGNIAMRTGKLMGVLSFIIITAANINLFKKTSDNKLRDDVQVLENGLCNELDKELLQEQQK